MQSPPSRTASHRRMVSASREIVRGPLEGDGADPLSTSSTYSRSESVPSSAGVNSPPPPMMPTATSSAANTSSPTRKAASVATSHMRSAGSTASSTQHQAQASLDVPKKDFSFLQNASVYHAIAFTSPLPAFSTSQNAPNSSTPLPVLLSKGHYRQAAIISVSNLLAAPPSAGPAVLSLLHTRLACLCLIQEHALAATEAKVLGDLNSAFYFHPLTGAHLVPWGLRVLAVRLQALGWGDGRRGIMGYYELAREARQEISRLKERKRLLADQNQLESDRASVEILSQEQELWSRRLREIGINVANTLVEVGDLEAAANHLASLRHKGDAHHRRSEEQLRENERIATMEALVWLRVGDVAAAQRCLHSVDVINASSTNSALTEPLPALITIANHSAPKALSALHNLLTAHPGDPLHTVNLAVARFYAGRLSEALGMLTALATGEQAPGSSPGDGETKKAKDAPPPFRALLFNAATLLDLSCEKPRERKLSLAERVASREARPECGGWERGLGNELKI